MNNNEKALNAIIARFNKEWQAVAEKAIKELYKLVEGGKKVDVAVKALKRKYPELFQLPGLIDSLVEATAYGYGIVPEVLTAAAYAKMATALERPWASDGMTLSKRLHGASKQMREAIVDTIRTQLNLNASWTNAARELYDGYNSGKAVVREQDIPNYLRLVRHATAGSPEQLRAARQAMNNINRLARNGAPTKSLKAAYNQLVQQALTGSDEALQKACWVAVQEKSRYVAERIARTEMARAYADGFLADIEADDDVVAVKWKTGTRHPVFDICDMYAKADMYGLGPGIYPKDKLPKLPAHPHCMCKLVKIYAADLDGKKAKENIEGAVNAYLEKLSDNQRMQLMGINGAKAWQSGESWQDYLRGWQGLGKQESRLRKILLQLHADEKLPANKDNGIIRVQKVSLTEEPYAITERVNSNGGIDRNYYDANGRQYLQITNNDHGQPKAHPFGKHGEHAHDYKYVNGVLFRGKGRELTEDERKKAGDFLEQRTSEK